MKGSKKSVVIGGLVITILAVAAIVFLCMYWFTDDSQITIDSPVPSGTVPTILPTPTSTPEPTKEPVDNTDFSISFEDDIKINIKGDDYINPDKVDEGVIGIGAYQKYYGTLVDGYDFSNGFYLVNTDRYTVTSNSVEGYVTSNIGVGCKVYELDPLVSSPQAEREAFLKSYWLNDYLNIEEDFKFNESKVELGEGYSGWEEVWSGYDSDPTMNGVQLVSDCVKDCAYGDVQWTLVYTPDFGVFEAQAVITCDRDRLLKIELKGSVMSDMWSTLREITNEVIRMVK